jgi:predicted Zn-dependent protease
LPAILLLPIDCKDDLILRRIQQAVSKIFPSLVCSIGPESRFLLYGCFNLYRQQYDASILLQKAADQLEFLAVDYFLGVTEADI